MNGESALYKEVDECLEVDDCSGDENNIVSVPIIGTDGYFFDNENSIIFPGNGIIKSGFYPIIGFGCARIIEYKRGIGNIPQSISAEFIQGCANDLGELGGNSYYGVLLPPKLAK